MSYPVMILGESGSGKTFSLKNVDAESSLLIQTIKKPLPFRSGAWKPFTKDGGSVFACDDWSRIVSAIDQAADYKKDKIFIDDFQYLLANEFMRRADEPGFQKFTDIGTHAWNVIMAAQNAPKDLRIYFLTHTDTDENGIIRCKTIGKLLNDKITVEGLFVIVLRAIVTDQGNFFTTKNEGFDPSKSPYEMFDSPRIQNDLAAVDTAICDYYNITQ